MKQTLFLCLIGIALSQQPPMDTNDTVTSVRATGDGSGRGKGPLFNPNLTPEQRQRRLDMGPGSINPVVNTVENGEVVTNFTEPGSNGNATVSSSIETNSSSTQTPTSAPIASSSKKSFLEPFVLATIFLVNRF